MRRAFAVLASLTLLRAGAAMAQGVLIAPHQVYDFLVREDRVCGRTTGAQQYGK